MQESFNSPKTNLNSDAEELTEGPNTDEVIKEIELKLKELGSRAEVNERVQGGIFTLEIPEELKEQLSDVETAIHTMESDSEIYNSRKTYQEVLRQNDWESLNEDVIDVVAMKLNLEEGSRYSRKFESDSLAEMMKELGYRPLTPAELMVFTITKKDCIKSEGAWFNAYRPYSYFDPIDTSSFSRPSKEEQEYLDRGINEIRKEFSFYATSEGDFRNNYATQVIRFGGHYPEIIGRGDGDVFLFTKE